MYTWQTIIFILFALSVATATVSVDTIELGVYVTNHQFCLFTLSVATATVSVDTIEHGVYIANHHLACLNLALLLQPLVSTLLNMLYALPTIILACLH